MYMYTRPNLVYAYIVFNITCSAHVILLVCVLAELTSFDLKDMLSDIQVVVYVCLLVTFHWNIL